MAAPLTTVTEARLRRLVQSNRLRLTLRLVVGVGVLVAVIAHVGTGPFVHGLLSLDWRSVVAAGVLAAAATAAAAWRWRLISTRLGVELRWSTALGMYYQSQFLNTVLPGGIVGDVHRAVSHGRRAENLTQSARAVAIERVSGQVMQLGLALVVLALFGAEFNRYLLAAVSLGLGVIVAALLATAAFSPRARRVLRYEARELHAGLGSVAAFAQVAIASLVVVACHVATFAIATAAVGENVPPSQMVSLAFVILLGASIPLNVGGWGPREGIAGWAFALAGFGASAGVAASTLFGILAIISVSPGVIVMVVFAVRRRTTSDTRPKSATPHVPVLTASNPERPS